MKSKKTLVKPKGPSILVVGLLCALAGMIATHCVWYFALLGLVESDVNAALLTGTEITGVLESTERYEEGYLAHVSTEDFGEVTVKISAETARSLESGASVQITNTLGLAEVKEAGDTNAQD